MSYGHPCWFSVAGILFQFQVIRCWVWRDSVRCRRTPNMSLCHQCSNGDIAVACMIDDVSLACVCFYGGRGPANPYACGCYVCSALASLPTRRVNMNSCACMDRSTDHTTWIEVQLVSRTLLTIKLCQTGLMQCSCTEGILPSQISASQGKKGQRLYSDSNILKSGSTGHRCLGA